MKKYLINFRLLSLSNDFGCKISGGISSGGGNGYRVNLCCRTVDVFCEMVVGKIWTVGRVRRG